MLIGGRGHERPMYGVRLRGMAPKDRSMRWGSPHHRRRGEPGAARMPDQAMRAIVEGSLYSEGSARRAISRLVEDGWIEVTERGGGHGHESVYRVPMNRPIEVSQMRDKQNGHVPRCRWGKSLSPR